jgi:threonine dehydratase
MLRGGRWMSRPAIERITDPLVPIAPDGKTYQIPTLRDVYRARSVIQRFLPRTPMLRPAALAERLGFDIFLKCENLQPIGAFKIRGGIYLVSQMSPEERARGLYTASTGNHGQSIAYAAREFGARATIFAPEGANPVKVAAMERLGAEVILVGPDFDTARREAEDRAIRDGATFIHSANEPHLIAGVATYSLEMLEEVPELDVLVIPAGGGSGLSGACIVGKTIDPAIQVIGVQAIGAPVIVDSWRQRRLLAYDRMDTFAEGLATREAFALPAQILWDRVDDFCLVSDRELRRAMVTLLETTRIVAEGAGAASLAAAYQLSDRFVGKKVGIVVSGGNVAFDAFKKMVNEEQSW